MPDDVFTNINSMTVDQIQAFLESKKSPLADKELYKKFYLTYPYDMDIYNLVFPNGKLARESSPAEIIFYGGRIQIRPERKPNDINPKVLLILLEFQTGLIEEAICLNQYTLDNALEFNSIEENMYGINSQGFLNQIIRMASQSSRDFEHFKSASDRNKRITLIDGLIHYPRNAATYALQKFLDSSEKLSEFYQFYFKYITEIKAISASYNPYAFLGANSNSVGYPVSDDNLLDDLNWRVPSNYFGHYYAVMYGFHPGEDWNLTGGNANDDDGKPVYAIANGRIEKVSDLGPLGYLIGIEHTTTADFPFSIPAKNGIENGQTYSYNKEQVTKIYSIYLHINNLPFNVLNGEGTYNIKRGEIVGYIMNPDGGPHLHFEIRHPIAENSNNWSLVLPDSNWATDPNTGQPTGYYKNLQPMVDAGLRDPTDFIRANSTAWDFNTNYSYNDAEFWTINNIESYSVEGGVFYIDPSISDPYIVSPSLSISATDYNAVQIRMASNAPDGDGNIYFITQTDSNWGEDKKVVFNISNSPLLGSAPYFEYIVYMGDHPNWSGTITGLRIDPSDSGVIGPADTIGIDYIRLEKVSRVAPSVDLYLVPGKASFSTGETQEKWVSASGGTGYSVNNYARVTMPDGTQKYAYYSDYPVQPSNPLLFSDIKRPLYNGTWVVEDRSWNWNTYTFSGSEAAGNYLWEFWYEDVTWQDIYTPPAVLASDMESYSFTPSSYEFSDYLDENNTSKSHTVMLPDDGELNLNIAYDSTLSVDSLRIYDLNNSILFSQYYPQSGVIYGGYGLKAGTYYIKVSRYSGYGNYTLSAPYSPQIIPNDSEPNDTFAEAGPIENNSSAPGHLGYRGGGNGSIDTVDNFKITLDTDGEYKLKIIYDSTLSMDSIRVYDLDNSILFSQYYPQSGVIYGGYGLKAGTYYIRIARYSGYGGYSLATLYNAQAVANDSEPNDTFAEAKSIENNSSVPGHLGYTGAGNGTVDTVDNFKITLTADGEHKFKVIYDSTLSVDSIRIYDLDNSILFSQYYPQSGVIYGGYGLKAGTYYIRIARYSGYGGYSLATLYNAQAVANDSEPNDSFSTAVPAPNNGDVTGHLGYKGGGDGTIDTVDNYRITLPSGGDLRLKMVFDSTLNISSIRIYDVYNSLMFSRSYPLSGVIYGPFSLSAGTYFVQINLSSGFGGYTLTTIFPSILPPTITVLSPNGGETWTVGSSRMISWTSSGTVGDVRIEYSVNSGSSWSTIIISTANDGSHPWVIPNTPSNTCLVRISEASDGSPSDTSDSVFAITMAGGFAYYVFDGHDFNGNGTSDVSVWRPSNGNWYIKNIGSQNWGIQSDIPVSGDYNGDSATDIAAWRPSNGIWYIRNIASFQWGISGDMPVPGNYNGNSASEVAIWRPSSGIWYIRNMGAYQWGTAGDIPVPGDYDGDNLAEIAVWRPSTGIWYIRGIGAYQWGTLGDIPVPGDYNGDGTIEIAVWRPSTGIWYIRGIGAYQWGTLGDIPVPGDYNGDGTIEIAVWRPSNGIWHIRNIGSYQWGQVGDIPLVK